MQTLTLNLLTKGPEGEPLPTVFPDLEMYGASIRRGQLTLICAASGVGKSSIVTYMAMNMENPDGKVPTLYFSADSDVTTFGIRAGTMATVGLSTRDTERLILDREPAILQQIEEETNNIWVCFDSSPSPRDIEDEVEAYAMVTGEYPHMIVVDNLMDVPTGGMEERSGQDAVLDFLKQLGGRTQAAVVVLCHAVGEYADGQTPIPLSGLMNKIDKRPRLVLTLYEADLTLLGVCIVKNNNGRRDASGGLQVFIPWVKEYMSITPGGR